MDNEIRDIIRQMRELTARLEALLPAEQTSQPAAGQQAMQCTATIEPEPVATTSIIHFTLNDRYRFMRELFGGSAKEMNEVVNIIESLSTEEETLGYIKGLGWNNENQVVKDFITVVTERFKASPTLLT